MSSQAVDIRDKLRIAVHAGESIEMGVAFKCNVSRLVPVRLLPLFIEIVTMLVTVMWKAPPAVKIGAFVATVFILCIAILMHKSRIKRTHTPSV